MEAIEESTHISQASSDAKDEEGESEDESESSNSDDDVNTCDTDFYKCKLDYPEKKYMTKHVEEGNMKLFHLFTAQCPLQLFMEIKSLDEFEDLEEKQDGIGLLV